MVREWCNQSDFVLTVMVTGRLAKEHLRVVGYLAQPLYMRVQTTPDTAFESLLNTVGKEYFSAVFHRDFGQTVLENPALGAGTLAAWVIARRDFSATVLSKTFIFFLLAPFLAVTMALLTFASHRQRAEELS